MEGPVLSGDGEEEKDRRKWFGINTLSFSLNENDPWWFTVDFPKKVIPCNGGLIEWGFGVCVKGMRLGSMSGARPRRDYHHGPWWRRPFSRSSRG